MARMEVVVEGRGQKNQPRIFGCSAVMGPMESVVEGGGGQKNQPRFLGGGRGQKTRFLIFEFREGQKNISADGPNAGFVDIVDGNGGAPGPAARKNRPGGKYNRKREQHVSFFAHAYRHYRQMRQSRVVQGVP